MITEKDIKKVSLILLIVGLAVLVFLILKPVLLSIIAGLILAYIFLPVYKLIVKVVKQKTVAAALVSILVLAIIIVPLWFLIPLMSQQIFNILQFSQTLDINGFIKNIFPTASDQFIAQINITIGNAFSKIASSILDSLTSFLINFAAVGLHLLLVAFVFFFALRDEEKLREFASGLSPLNKAQEKDLVKNFKDITESILYGQVLIGVLQGILLGIGLFIFDVPNVVLLTTIAVILSIIPFVGPAFVYVPVTIYVLSTREPMIAAIFLAYNLLIVSTIDNFLRAHIVSKKTKISQVFVVIGIVGGLFIFGILGIILGPLIIAYFLTFLQAYKNKTLSSLFSSD